MNAGVGDARAVTTHSSFDTLFDGDAAAFAISEAGWTPSLLGQPGHYRFILWNDQRSWPRWDQSGDQTAPPGVAISFDQRFEQGVTLFCRYGYEDPAVYQVEHFWSVGGQLSEFSSMRPDDVIGVGMAESILSRAYRDSTDPVGGPHETLYEAYYLFYLDEFVTFTPVAQLLCHPLADPDAGSIIACGARLVVGF